jgi:ParB-like chromosome segregation protein Spo0J
LTEDFCTRLAGPDEATVRALSELDEPLPPILVHRQTNRVIDGMHRLLAARRRGAHTIRVIYQDCDEASAFVMAVNANVTHGLPLSLSDRKAAAARILSLFGSWSNRRIAVMTGLSDKTVGAIRVQSGESGGESPRVGLDGRARPVDPAVRRQAVAQLLAERPSSSLRQIAVAASVSPDTVRTVKAQVRKAAELGERRGGRRARGVELHPQQCLRLLANDPVLRSSDAGRLLLRALSAAAVVERDMDNLAECVPEYSLALLQRLALANAGMWRSLADRAAQREKHGVERSPSA